MRKFHFFKVMSLALVLSLGLPVSASARWVNEELGPGAAVWVDDTAPDGSSDGSAAPGYEQSENIIIPVDSSGNSGSSESGDGQSPQGSENSDGQNPAGGENAGEDTSGNSEGTGEKASAGNGNTGSSEASGTDGENTENSQGGDAQGSALPANAVMSNGRILYLDKPMIALTYDDGPNPKVGNRIMDMMAKYNGRATFFMVGNRVPAYADEVRRMVNEGHEVANHSYSHKYLNKYDAATIRAEVENCNNIIQSVCGVRPTLMRLPGGNKNATVLSNVNMPIILWNIDTRDWEHKNAQKTINEVMSKVKDGDVILMHELYNATADASDYLIPTLTAQGYQLVTVSELAQYKGAVLQPNGVYYSF